jgi:hypothetical protein
VPLAIGTTQTVPNSDFFGDISNVRLIKGTCQYPNGTAFSVPTGPLTAVAGTSLLTCRDRYIRDVSSNSFAVVRVANPRATIRNPFSSPTGCPYPTDASQSNAASRPVLRARYNLLTFSEQFDNAVWAKPGLITAGMSNVAVAPDGTTTAEQIIPTAANEFHCLQFIAGFFAATMRFSIHLKAIPGSAYNWVGVRIWNGTAYTGVAYFNVATGQLGTVTAGTAVTAVNAGNGWWRVGVIGAQTAASNSEANIIVVANDGGSSTFLGDGTSGVYAWGAQLQLESTAALNGAYQKIEAATIYNATGFAPYLDFDGTDDCLFTGNLDLTATDEITAHVGMIKLNDASNACIVETSADASLNNGAWHFLSRTGGLFNYIFRARGTSATVSQTPSSYPAPSTVK